MHRSHFLKIFIYPWTLTLIPYLAIVNKAVMNMGVSRSFPYTHFFSLGYVHSRLVAGSYNITYLIFFVVVVLGLNPLPTTC
jgi:hypothetical protein